MAAFRYTMGKRLRRLGVRATANASVTWHYCRPPIAAIEYEMDLRAVSLERVLAA